MNNFTTFANRDVSDLVFCEYKTKKPFLNCDWANTTATELTGETVYAYGGKGRPKRVAFTGDSGGTLKIETQLQTMQMYSLMLGANIDTKASWMKREVLTAAENGVTLSEVPLAGTVFVFEANDDCGKSLTISADTSSKKVTGTDITDGKQFIVYYQIEKSTGVQKVSVKSTTFPKAFTVYGDTWDKAEDESIISQKMIAYKCQPQKQVSFSWANSGDPATITITCDLLADDQDRMLDLITYEEDSE